MAMFDPNEFALPDAQEPYAMPDGTEAKVRIIECTVGKDKNGLTYFMPRLEICDEPFSKDFTYFMHAPDRGMDAKRLNRVRFMISQFFEAFSIDPSRPFDHVEDWQGLESWAILGLRRDAIYGEQNYVKSWVLAPSLHSDQGNDISDERPY